MLCSICNKNTAVIFINKLDNNKNKVEGLCYNCAKEKGINPLELLAKQAHLSEDELSDMSEQLENIFNDISENFSAEDLKNMENKDSSIGPFLNTIFGMNNHNTNDNNDTNSNDSTASSSSTERKKVKTEKRPKDKKKKFLDTFGTNLTEKATQGKIDCIIGRDKEIERITQILNRRSKNNPCLIGEPGVGKTAIAQGLAIRIAEGKVPAKLLNKEVYLLDMTSIIAGTQFRGQFEARMKSLIDECKSYGNIILVIEIGRAHV